MRTLTMAALTLTLLQQSVGRPVITRAGACSQMCATVALAFMDLAAGSGSLESWRRSKGTDCSFLSTCFVCGFYLASSLAAAFWHNHIYVYMCVCVCVCVCISFFPSFFSLLGFVDSFSVCLLSWGCFCVYWFCIAFFVSFWLTSNNKIQKQKGSNERLFILTRTQINILC